MYQSPLHIFDGAEISTEFLADKNALRRFRQKLLADYALNNEIEMESGGRRFTKNDLLVHLDALLNDTDTELHLFIYSNAALLQFLESNTVPVAPDALQQSLLPTHLENELQPLIEKACLSRIRKCFQQKDFTQLRTVLQITHSVFNQLPGTVIDKLFDQLSNLVQVIREHYFDRNKNGIASLNYLGDKDFYQFLSELPEEYHPVRNELLQNILNYLQFVFLYKKESLQQIELILEIAGRHDFGENFKQKLISFLNQIAYTNRSLEDSMSRTAINTEPVKDTSMSYSAFGYLLVLVVAIMFSILSKSDPKPEKSEFSELLDLSESIDQFQKQTEKSVQVANVINELENEKKMRALYDPLHGIDGNFIMVSNYTESKIELCSKHGKQEYCKSFTSSDNKYDTIYHHPKDVLNLYIYPDNKEDQRETAVTRTLKVEIFDFINLSKGVRYKLILPALISPQGKNKKGSHELHIDSLSSSKNTLKLVCIH